MSGQKTLALKALEEAVHNAALAALEAERVTVGVETPLSADARFLESVEMDLVRLQERVQAYRRQLAAAHSWFLETRCGQCNQVVERGYEGTHARHVHEKQVPSS